MTIDAGSDDGIKRDMTVLNGDGLVGRVTTVGPARRRASRVRARVGCRAVRPADPAVLQGQGLAAGQGVRASGATTDRQGRALLAGGLLGVPDGRRGVVGGGRLVGGGR
ncbi:rod shape-determining protein MreC, partial [Streptomyces sp. SP18CS02]|uniref:rod shape-determining protein MreC n=1 Tax=Streptomyces sp. SP18CS02 TaxID=3002531 RepID=UPI003FCCCF7B